MVYHNSNHTLPGVNREGSGPWHPTIDRIYVFEHGQKIRCPYCGKSIPDQQIEYHEVTDIKEVASGYCDVCRVDFDFDVILPKKRKFLGRRRL